MILGDAAASVTLLRAALDGLAEAVTVHDRDGNLIYVNEQAARMMGCASVEQALATPPGSWMERFAIFGEDGRPLAPADLPGRQAFAGRAPDALVVRYVERATRETSWVRIQARPLLDEHGGVAAAVNAIADVTAVKEAELAQRLLARAGEVLSSSLDYERTLQEAASLAVPQLADWCGIDLVDDRGGIEPVAIAHVDPAKAALGRELRERYPTDPDSPGGVPAVIRTGEVELIQDVTDEMIVAAARDEVHLELVRGVGICAALIVPMKAGPRAIGALSLVLAEQDRHFSDGDITVARELARRAATAIENARLYTERAAIAHTLQAGLVPGRLDPPPGFELAHLFRPAGSANEVGGDFYDIVELGDRRLAFVGDVAGKGAPAAAITSRARYTLTTAAQLTGEVGAALARVNASLLDLHSAPLCTVACVTLDDGAASGRAEIVCAGHPAPVIVSGSGARPLETGGIMLGAVPGASWETVTVDLAPGDAIVLYTDGVTDTVGDDGRFGTRRLLAALDAPRASARELVQRLDAALRDFQSTAQRDDVAVVALRRVDA